MTAEISVSNLYQKSIFIKCIITIFSDYFMNQSFKVCKITKFNLKVQGKNNKFYNLYHIEIKLLFLHYMVLFWVQILKQETLFQYKYINVKT